MNPKSTTLRVSEERKMALERAAIEISYKTGISIKWTELANHLFDKWLNEAKKDLIASTDVKKILKKD
ncbi:hypothetical protein [Shewanella xiamenensis]|uniref:hypothetical protein n=2 Tax=Shewanella xiamenensis TaxID=332186 RepID=UPI0011860927|nr:hypothetical protein [Shewanella xiamenensis]MDV5248558.1 hypothetical protein [Shewanella xiamenensis]MDV5248567.1 hypothetical protein [Shewanella xiamenensis]MDV5248576.1 hypothetical protein [Shewanella xiamenensis]MDV5248585.1 hypothetical protein [Shewanella xiamenensis]TVL11312.1 hypothetical protein AYI91_21100 [Shewanella xiamenensis]